MKTRRTFLGVLLIAGVVTGFPGIPSTAQNPSIPPDKRPGPPDTSLETPPLPSAEKRLLEENEKDIKKKVERLFDLATELKAEVEKTDSSKVLNLNMVRKAEEIEKLAREIKTRSKG
ncbi:MAG TPA: hypothetical protein VJX70_07395 [Candidatus Acidoferrum sp.]|nr:hypothetical protein [Candidatus Acidoferrum sp.]